MKRIFALVLLLGIFKVSAQQVVAFGYAPTIAVSKDNMLISHGLEMTVSGDGFGFYGDVSIGLLAYQAASIQEIKYKAFFGDYDRAIITNATAGISWNIDGLFCAIGAHCAFASMLAKYNGFFDLSFGIGGDIGYNAGSIRIGAKAGIDFYHVGQSFILWYSEQHAGLFFQPYVAPYVSFIIGGQE